MHANTEVELGDPRSAITFSQETTTPPWKGTARVAAQGDYETLPGIYQSDHAKFQIATGDQPKGTWS